MYQKLILFPLSISLFLTFCEGWLVAVSLMGANEEEIDGNLCVHS